MSEGKRVIIQILCGKLTLFWRLTSRPVLSRYLTTSRWPSAAATCSDVLPFCQHTQVKVKVRTHELAPLHESPPQKRSGMARVLKESHSFTCTPTHSIRSQNEWYLLFCLPCYSWYSFTDLGGMEGWVGLGGLLRSETVYLPESSHPSYY